MKRAFMSITLLVLSLSMVMMLYSPYPKDATRNHERKKHCLHS